MPVSTDRQDRGLRHSAAARHTLSILTAFALLMCCVIAADSSGVSPARAADEGGVSAPVPDRAAHYSQHANDVMEEADTYLRKGDCYHAEKIILDAEAGASAEDQKAYDGRLAVIYSMWSFEMIRSGMIPDAITIGKQRLDLAIKMADTKTRCSTLIDLGMCYTSEAQYKEATRCLKEALALSRQLGSKADEAAALSRLGNVYRDLGQYPEAISSYEKSLRLATEAGAKTEEEETLMFLSQTCLSQDKPGDALKYALDGLAKGKAIGEPQHIMEDLAQVGRAYYALRQYDKAADYYLRALKMADGTYQLASRMDIRIDLGIVRDSQGRQDEALKLCEEAMVFAKKIDDKDAQKIIQHNIDDINRRRRH